MKTNKKDEVGINLVEMEIKNSEHQELKLIQTLHKKFSLHNLPLSLLVTSFKCLLKFNFQCIKNEVFH